MNEPTCDPYRFSGPGGDEPSRLPEPLTPPPPLEPLEPPEVFANDRPPGRRPAAPDPPPPPEDSNGMPNPQDMLRALHGFTTQCPMNLEGHKQAESLRALLEKWIESHR